MAVAIRSGIYSQTIGGMVDEQKDIFSSINDSTLSKFANSNNLSLNDIAKL